MENKDWGKTSTGMPANGSALLCYAAGLVTGFIFFLIEKDNKFVRFHAIQSMVVFGGLFVIQIALTVIPYLGWVFIPLVNLAGIVLWILLMIKAYQGEKFKLPIAGDVAEQKSGI